MSVDQPQEWIKNNVIFSQMTITACYPDYSTFLSLTYVRAYYLVYDITPLLFYDKAAVCSSIYWMIIVITPGNSFHIILKMWGCSWLSVFVWSYGMWWVTIIQVMVWIHGGALAMGSASFYDGSALAAYQNVVVVLIQYRLGMLGFLRWGYTLEQ